MRFVASLVQGDGHDFKALQSVPHRVHVIDCGDQGTEQIEVRFQPGRCSGLVPMIRPVKGKHMVAHAAQHVPVVAGKRQLAAAFASRILVDKITAVDDHVCGEAQVPRVFVGVFCQGDEQQGHRGEPLLTVDEQTTADAVRADAALLHPYDRPGEMGSVRMPAGRYDVSPQLPALRLAP